MAYVNHLNQMRLQRVAEYLNRQPARLTAEYLAEIAQRIGGLPAILAIAEEYRSRITPAMLAASGGDKFLPRPLRGVPR